MADDTPPDELVQARRAFMAATAPKTTVESGAVVANAELNAKMNAVREELRRLAEFIAGHAWIRDNGVHAAWLKVNAAAKAAE